MKKLLMLVVVIIGIGAYYTKEDKQTKQRETGSAKAINANVLLASYLENEVRADETFKGKWCVLTGKVDTIGKDILNNSYITFQHEGQLRHVQCFFKSKSEKEKLSKLDKGDPITIAGKVSGLMGNVGVEDCQILSLSEMTGQVEFLK